MKFLTLSTLITAAALAVPALLLLYFLKLKRQEFKISSTLLWRKAVQDLQVNAPFQKLRKNLLLFLQLLVLAGLIFALGQPVAKFVQHKERTIVMLLDQSGSTKSKEGSGTRLEEVKRAASEFVQDLGGADQAMLIAFADRARVVCPFTNDKKQLQRRIESVEATDSRSTLSEALQLAVAHSSKIVDVPGVAAPIPTSTADIELFSDGRIEDADDQVVQRGSMRYYKIGAATDNVGIVAMDARRSYEKPDQVSIFARVENFGPAAVKTDVTLLLDGKILGVRELSLAAADPTTTQPGLVQRIDTSRATSAQNLAFEMTHESAGIAELRINREDMLAADDVAYAPLAPPRELSVLGVGDRPVPQSYISRAVRSVPGVSFEWMSCGEYEQASDEKLTEGGRSKYDLVVFDLCDTAKLPPGNYLFLGGAPKIAEVTAEGETENEHVVNWDETSPLMRYVQFDKVNIAKWRRLKLPRQAARLVEGETSAVIAMLNDSGRQMVLVAFDLMDSDFPLKVPFVLFIQNVVRSLTASGGEVSRMLRPGETITVPVPRGANEARVSRPDGNTDKIDVSGRAQGIYGRTDAVGLYKFAFDDSENTTATYAVNLLDRNESLIAPNERFRVGADVIQREDSVERSNQPLWPYAVMAAIAVLLVEWWIYNRRVMI